MTFEIFKAFPPDRESSVVELSFKHDGFVEVPAEIYDQNGTRVIAIFGREGGLPWIYPFDDWVAALKEAAEALGDL